jgi:hypothetical protein
MTVLQLKPASTVLERMSSSVWVGLNIHRLANPCGLWQTVGMTNQQQCPQRREDYKVQKLVKRIETKLALQAKAILEASQTSSKTISQ